MTSKQATLDKPIDLTKERQRREDAEGYMQRRDSELDDVAWLMSEERGRRFMFRLMSMCGVNRSSFTGNSQTFFNEGMRIIGTTLITDVTEAGLEELELKMKIEHRDSMRKKESKDG